MEQTIVMKHINGKFVVSVREGETVLSFLTTEKRSEVAGLIKKAQEYFPTAKLTA